MYCLKYTYTIIKRYKVILMKTSKIIGKKVLDCNANDVGKVQDVDIDIKSNNINEIIINSGELSLRKVNIEVTPDMIAQVGDYLLLNVSNKYIDVIIINTNNIETRLAITLGSITTPINLIMNIDYNPLY